jgi:hypothetical protein
VSPKILALIAGAVLLGAGVISVWIIVREGSPANAPNGKLPLSAEATPANRESAAKRTPAEHKQPSKAHKH